MVFLYQIIVGSIAGFLASKLVNKTGQGLALDIVVGAAGAVVGGLVFNATQAPGTVGLNLYSLPAALIGSVAVLWAWHVLVRRADPQRSSVK